MENKYRLRDIEFEHDIIDQNLFAIRRKMNAKGHQIGEVIDRVVWVTAEERDYLLSRLGKRGRGNWLTGGKHEGV